MLGKRPRVSTPPLSERVMLYVRQDTEDVYTALHVVPPTTQGLLHAVSTPPAPYSYNIAGLHLDTSHPVL